MADISCQHCRAAYAWPVGAKGSQSDGARSAGWVVWEGLTLGGQHVKRVYCPVCRGVAEPTQAELSWDAVCQTCDCRMSEEWGDDEEGPFTENDADQWKADHRCEPWVDKIQPVPPGRDLAQPDLALVAS
ncbi:hypothetical protein ACIBHX_01595 [Nonomuraea sp. NPDC050536]|uniref:hypothetical protein n=1 Tax=Nonomuraea sp. NPDC050536 TaxID=3364366 RepID=UPI0037C697C2